MEPIRLLNHKAFTDEARRVISMGVEIRIDETDGFLDTFDNLWRLWQFRRAQLHEDIREK